MLFLARQEMDFLSQNILKFCFFFQENCSETGMMESRVFKVLGLQPCENSEVDSLALYSELIRAGLEPAGLLYPR